MMMTCSLVSFPALSSFDVAEKSGQADTMRWALYTILRRKDIQISRWQRNGALLGSWDAGPAQRTGSDAGIRFHPGAGSAGGNENSIPLVLTWPSAGSGAAGRTDGAHYRAQQMYGGSLLYPAGCGRKMASTRYIIERVKGNDELGVSIVPQPGASFTVGCAMSHAKIE